MTIVGALSYGELAAMMPRAGGQYVYLREALGPLWGFLYGWTLFLVIQTGTIAAVGVAFGKFLGVFFPSISSTQLDPASLEGSADSRRPDGAGQHGCRHQHAEPGRDPAGDFSFGGEHLWSEDGRGHSEHFHRRQGFGAAGAGAVRICLGRNAQAMAANFGGNFWHNAGLGAQHAVQVGVGGPIVHGGNA